MRAGPGWESSEGLQRTSVAVPEPAHGCGERRRQPHRTPTLPPPRPSLPCAPTHPWTWEGHRAAKRDPAQESPGMWSSWDNHLNGQTSAGKQGEGEARGM